VRNRVRDALQKSFLERNQKIIGAIGLVVLLTATGFGLLLQGGLLTPKYTVKAYFSDAAGIRSGDRVTVAGLNAGNVTGVAIENGKVAIDLGIHNGVELPRDSRAEITIETLLGRRAVNMVAGQSDQMLEDGDVIPESRTQTPIDITDLNDISVRLLNHSDAGAFNQLLEEVSKITQDKADQVRQLVTGLGKVVTAVDARRQELRQLLDALSTVSTVLGEKSQTIVSLINNLNVVLENLARHSQDIRTLLVATDSSSHQTADLVSRNRSALDSTLGFLHNDLDLLAKHQVDLAASISYLEQAVQGYSSVGYSNGVPNHWANIFVQSLGPAGVDAAIGKCGAVDQFFDKFFGTDCAKSDNFNEIKIAGAPRTPQVGAAPSTGTSTLGGLNLNVPLPKLPQVPLPCSINDLVKSVLSAQPQGCLP
jgi:phospholipid/cholesterol/gamma-HCH transport system substrate-binding protein